MKRWSVRHVPQLFAATLLLIGIVAFTTAPRETFAGSKYLGVSLYGQEQSNWCWAAANKMIMNWHGTSASQCAIVDKVFSGCPNQGAYLHEAASALRSYGFNADEWNGWLGAKTVVQELDAGRPFYVHWNWSSGGAHAVVVRGYNSNSSGSAATVYYADPLPLNRGRFASLSYDDFVDNGTHEWVKTIWDIRD
ncbi:MAG: hypothetical protein GFH25_541210n36 [Chloroflexi bacterium AL-N10]|nr:hypothetical protein [Chloroflexi bacterium AL-N1]NOK69609.1 hypothetical protein [Chloroflexi bacterium AL-N10]NOK72156.1 hypothetical protein [Chloroflexi bacterium AL-N5]